jgi:hypothetical protein
MNTEIKISDLFSSKELRDIFRRAERDQGFAFAIPTPKSPELSGGASKKLPELA